MKISIVTFLTLFAVYIAGCSDNSTSTSNNYNSVSIRSVNDTLAVSISTTNHTYNDTVQLAFSVDSVNFSISVSGYGGGSGLFKVLHDTNTTITKDLSTNYQSTERIYTGIPTNAIIQLVNYKGNASILLTK